MKLEGLWRGKRVHTEAENFITAVSSDEEKQNSAVRVVGIKVPAAEMSE